MPLARTARRLAGPIARIRLLRSLLALCRITDFTGRGVGPTLGGGGGGDPMRTLRSSHRIEPKSTAQSEIAPFRGMVKMQKNRYEHDIVTAQTV